MRSYVYKEVSAGRRVAVVASTTFLFYNKKWSALELVFKTSVRRVLYIAVLLQARLK